MTEKNTDYNNIRLCECGCGNPLPIPKFPSYQRRYIHKHGRKGINHHNWKGGRILDNKGYIMIWKPEHPFVGKTKYIFEHRLVMEEYLGRYLKPKEVVHHINVDIRDNRIENLMLLESQSKHFSIHLT